MFDSHDNQVRFMTAGGSAAIAIPNESIRSIVYERAAKAALRGGHPGRMPLIFTKSKKHFVTFQYKEKGKGLTRSSRAHAGRARRGR